MFLKLELFIKRNLILILTIILISCHENSLIEPVSVDGIWVETTAMTDTIEFAGQSIMILRRGTELINGNKLPKSSAGPYSYKINDNEISLYWALSSLWESKTYYFKQTKDLIEIGNFYEGDPGSDILTFQRLK